MLCPSGYKGEVRRDVNKCVKPFREPLCGKYFESRGQHNVLVFCSTKGPHREFVSVSNGTRGSPAGETPRVPSSGRQVGVSGECLSAAKALFRKRWVSGA